LETIEALDGDDTNDSTPVALTATGDASQWAGSGVWVTGQITFDSDRSFTITAGTTEVLTSTDAVGGQLQSVDKVDISTVDAATRTLALVDSALSAVNAQRA